MTKSTACGMNGLDMGSILEALIVTGSDKDAAVFALAELARARFVYSETAVNISLSGHEVQTLV